MENHLRPSILNTNQKLEKKFMDRVLDYLTNHLRLSIYPMNFETCHG